MQVSEIRNRLSNLQMHIDQMYTWARQATNIAFEIENAIFDQEDNDYNERYMKRIGFLDEAASQLYQFTDSPPRRIAARCDRDHIVAEGFLQSNVELKKIV
jgi:hypothetical protein